MGREIALEQLKRFELLANGLGFPMALVGHHISKSIQLPVICITCPGMKVYLRDNFHDINICVVADAPLNIPLSVLFEGVLPTLSWDWYLEQMSRCRGYSWREWTDEQMASPGLLAPSFNAPNHMFKTLAEKVRWEKRLTDPEWYVCDWSHGKIVWEGDFGPGAAMWVQGHPFLQGITEHVPSQMTLPYEPGCSGFALALNTLDQVTTLIQRLLAHRQQDSLESQLTTLTEMAIRAGYTVAADWLRKQLVAPEPPCNRQDGNILPLENNT